MRERLEALETKGLAGIRLDAADCGLANISDKKYAPPNYNKGNK